jgi:golgi phosphoprotein 3
MLSLPEELMLLALHDEKGTVVSSASLALNYGLAGAILMELTLSGHIASRGDNLHVAKTRHDRNDLLNDALKLIRQSERDRKAKHWINYLSRKIKIKDQLLERLIKQGILCREEHKILWVFNANRYPTKDTKAELEVRSIIRDVVLKNQQPSERTVVLLALVQACSLVSEVFDKEDRKQAESKIKKIVESNEIGKAVSQTVTEIQAALIAISVITMVTVTSSH